MAGQVRFLIQENLYNQKDNMRTTGFSRKGNDFFRMWISCDQDLGTVGLTFGPRPPVWAGTEIDRAPFFPTARTAK